MHFFKLVDLGTDIAQNDFLLTFLLCGMVILHTFMLIPPDLAKATSNSPSQDSNHPDDLFQSKLHNAHSQLTLHSANLVKHRGRSKELFYQRSCFESNILYPTFFPKSPVVPWSPFGPSSPCDKTRYYEDIYLAIFLYR